MADPQYSEPIQIGAKAQQSVRCANCQQDVPAGQYYSYKGQKGRDVFLCARCRETVERALEEESRNPNLPGAVALGIVAGLVAGVVWYGVVVVTGYEIGYLGIGAGYLVGQAVYWGAGRKRGSSLQFLSAGMTLLTLFAANYFTFLHFLRRYLLAQKIAGYDGHFFFISPLGPDFLKNSVSPIGLLIWAIALYTAFSVPKSRVL